MAKNDPSPSPPSGFAGLTPETAALPWTLPWQVLQAASRTVQLAPDALQQSINSGWSFGNVNVNSNNSSAPATELAIVARESYGRQLGRLMDAVEVLVRRLPAASATDAGDEQALADFEETRRSVAAAKDAARRQRVERLAADLTWLSEHDDEAWRATRARLRELLDRLP